MHTISATDAKQSFAAMLETAAREPVLIRKQNRDVAVVLSITDYQRLTSVNLQSFQQFCDRVGAEAETRGLTADKLAALLADRDA